MPIGLDNYMFVSLSHKKKNNLTKLFLFSTLLVAIILTTSDASAQLVSPIKAKTIGGLMQQIVQWILNLAVPLSAVMTIWGAVLLMTAGGNPQKVKQAQNALGWAMGGLVVVMLIEGLFGFGKDLIANASSLTQLINTIQQYLLLIVGPLSLVMYFYSAFLMSTSNIESIKKAKSILIWTSVAVAIISIFSVANLINLINQLAK